MKRSTVDDVLRQLEAEAYSKANAGDMAGAEGVRLAVSLLNEAMARTEEAPPAGPREILAVLWGQAEAQGAADYEAGRVFGGPSGGARTNVRVAREKIRAESTWRWGWVVVADARKEGT